MEGQRPCTVACGPGSSPGRFFKTIQTLIPIYLLSLGSPPITRSVKFLRSFVLICFGLFVQVAAHAAAVPEIETVEMVDCAEMTQAMSEHMDAEKKSSDRNEPCQDMTLECLVAMNCLPVLALIDAGAPQTPSLAAETAYLPAIADRLKGRRMQPESPPPQANLTV